jgi:hypothetical protein
MRTITTEESMDLSKRLIDQVQNEIKNDYEVTEDNTIHFLFFNKIINNFLGACLLSAHCKYPEARILIRTAFETLVLMTYYIKYPTKIQDYYSEEKVGGLEFLIRLYEMKQKDIEEIKEYCITKLDSGAKKIIQMPHYRFENQSALEVYRKIKKKNPTGFKYKSQSIWPKIKELKGLNFLDAEFLYEYGWIMYKYNSAIAHSSMGSLISCYSSRQIKDEHEEIKEIYRQLLSTLISAYSKIELVQKKSYPRKWAKEFFQLWEYLGFRPLNLPEKITSSWIIALPTEMGLIYPEYPILLNNP